MADRARELKSLQLSPLQQGILFHALADPDSGVYLQQVGMTIEGGLDAAALERAFAGAVARHDALRTSIEVPPGGPRQTVHPIVDLPWETVDLSSVPSEEQEAQIAGLLANDRRRGLDLRPAPVMRLTLIRLGPRLHRLIWTHHHALIDGWSAGLVLSEVLDGYDAAVSGRSSPQPAPPQYEQFIEWLGRQDASASDDFWRPLLQGAEPSPLAVAPPATGSGLGSLKVELSVEESEAVTRFARRERLTPNAVLLGAWTLTLRRYCGRLDVTFGVTVSGRPYELEESASIVGLFINTLPMRVGVDPGARVAPWLRSLQELQLDIREHEQTPLAHIQGLAGVTGGSALFDSIFVFENFPTQPQEGAGGVRFEVNLNIEQPHYSLTVFASPGPTYTLGLYFDRGKIGERDAQRILSNLQHALGLLTSDPDQPLSSLDLRAPDEQRLLDEWSRSGKPAAFEAVHMSVERHARERPDAAAVTDGESALSYSQLDATAQGIASRLESLGAAPETVVGVLLPRSARMVAAQLAVLKTGAAYLPLDPDLPLDRLRFMLENSGAVAVVMDASDGPADFGVPTVAPSAPNTIDRAEGFTSLPPHPRSLAYVIYTSGSTGIPKAVMVEHRGLSNLVIWHAGTYSVNEQDRASHLAALTFDASVWELWPYLCAGASVYLCPDEVRVDTELLARWLEDEEITIAFVPTPLADAMTSAGHIPRGPLRLLLTGGDRLLHRPVADSSFELINHYGPTENTVVATAGTVGAADTESPDIGRPIQGTNLYVLGENFMRVPPGVSGEIFIGGVQVARGYLGGPALTAERFLPDPFSDQPGAVMYRTGDLARFRPDGRIEFIGRSDHQVKIRGYRIELGEIEAQLAAHPAVMEAVAVVRQQGSGPKQLVAYVTCSSAADDRDLTAHLAQRLPEYMLPRRVVILDRMPLSPSGKIDRSKLPGPEGEADTPDAAPRSEIEARLAQIWTQVLGVEQVGIHDNFFDLGGDSIVSIQIVAKAAAQSIRLTPKQMFSHQTVAELAQVASVQAAQEKEQPQQVLDDHAEVGFTPIQLWLLEQAGDAGIDHFNQSLVLELEPGSDALALAAAVNQVVEHHEQLRARFTRGAFGWTQKIAPVHEAGEAFSTIDLSGAPKDHAHAELQQIYEQAQRSLSISQGPVFKAVHVRLPDTERLLLIAHHLVVDAVSFAILQDDLDRSYHTALQGGAADLGPSTTSFRRWAELLAERARSHELEEHCRLWLEMEEPPAVPVDRTGLNVWGSAKTLAKKIPRAASLRLEAAAAGGGAGVHDLLLAALVRALAGYGDQRAAGVDIESHGRHEIGRAELSRTVGWFTSIQPLSLRVEESLEAQAAAVAEARTRMALQGLDYGIARYLGPDPLRTRLRARRAPQVGFNYLGRLFSSRTATFTPAEEPTAAAFSPSMQRAHIFDLEAGMTPDGLEVQLTYSENLHELRSAEAILDQIVHQLRSAAASGADDIKDEYALTPVQEGILFHHLMDEASSLYHEQIWFDLEGPLDLHAFEESWRDVIAQHPILRTAFEWEGRDAPVQRVHREVDFALSVHELEHAEEEAIDALMRGDRETPFDLMTPRLMRVMAIKTPTRTRIVWSHHHILLDGWSGGLVLEEVFTRYEGRVRGLQQRLEETPRPYRDFVRWTREQDPGNGFWETALASADLPTPLGVDAGTGESGFGSFATRLERDLSEAVRDFARTQRVTLGSALQAAWARLLSAYSGRSDVVFGVTLSGREVELEGVEEMVGLFINTLPLRVRGADASPGEVALRVQEQMLELRARTWAPLVEVRRRAGLRSDLPLFESIFVFENYPSDPAPPGGLTVSASGSFESTNFPLTIAAEPDEEIGLRIFYDMSRFTPRVVEAVARDLVATLEGMAEQRQVSLSAPALVRDVPRSVREWAAPPADVAASGPTETVIAKVWSEVLDVRVSASDGFFQLGGHSLTATQIVSRLRDLFGVSIGVKTLFETPTVAGLAEAVVVATGGREAADALASVALRGGGGGRSRGVIPRRSIDSPPASVIQRWVWRFHHIEPGNPAYNIAGAVRLEGPLDVASLARAVHEVSMRHESLRTTFVLRDDQLIQVVGEEPAHMEQLELTALPRAQRYDQALALVEQKSLQAFDLVQGSLFRMLLMTLDDEDHLLFFGMHHIISDGWSVGVLQRDLREIYRAHSTGTGPKLPRLEIQYADFAVWQRDRITRGELDDQLEFWVRELEGAPRTLLTTDRLRPAVRTFTGSSLDLRLDPELGMRLESLMHRLNVTPFAVLLSAFSAVLHTESGAEDMVIGTPAAGRGHLDLEHLIGLFLNLIPVRLKLSRQSSFEELVMTTRDSIMEAFMNQDVPFPVIADRLDPQPDDARPALFQVVFNMINTPGGRFELPGLRTNLVLPSQVSAKQDMTLYAIEDAGSFAFELVYNSALFVEERVAALLEKFRRVLEEAARDATRPIGHILDAASAQAPLG